MKILFNGDSNVAGEELIDRSKSMSGVIARHFDAEYENLSFSGASNDRIYNTTLEYLDNNTVPDLVIIGWTEHHREQWYFDGRFHEINHIGVGETLPENFRRRYQIWKNHVQRHGEFQRYASMYWHNKIFNLHTMLLEKNIPHYFFNAFMAFPNDVKEQLDWKHHFFRPYFQNQCYVTWCQEKGFEEITPGWLHFDEQAHEAYANELIKVMCNDIKI